MADGLDPLEQWKKTYGVKYALPPDADTSKSVLGAKMLTADPEKEGLRAQFPMASGFLKGAVMGTAPDELGGSVLDPKTAQERQGAEAGFDIGTALQVAPLVGPILRGVRGVAGAALGGPAAGSRAAQRGVIKAPGGNWLSGSVEESLRGLKSGRPTHRDEALALGGRWARDADLPEVQQMMAQEGALNNWIDKQLTHYVKNDMASERDPVRALAERGVLHIGPDQLPRAHATGHPSGGMLEKLGQTPLAKAWENASDNTIYSEQARTFLSTRNGETGIPTVERNPWLAKVPPKTNVYDTLNMRPRDLGFNHLIDELRNATNPASGLPRNLQIKPESLQQLSVPQAVERVAKINEWREAQRVEANLAKANNAATVTHKEYPDKGYRWVELKEPGVNPDKGMYDAEGTYKSLEDALKYEGDTMGHCVGGYCPDVIEGRSRIYSLRDAKGQPHVTIEVGRFDTKNIYDNYPEIEQRASEVFKGRMPTQIEEDLWLQSEYPDIFAMYSDYPHIVQIKGKGNKAPKEEYLPFVQDFVKSGRWSDVGDLSNAGMRKIGDKYLTLEEVKAMSDRISNAPLFSMTGAPIATGAGAGYNAQQPEPAK